MRIRSAGLLVAFGLGAAGFWGGPANGQVQPSTQRLLPSTAPAVRLLTPGTAAPSPVAPSTPTPLTGAPAAAKVLKAPTGVAVPNLVTPNLLVRPLNSTPAPAATTLQRAPAGAAVPLAGTASTPNRGLSTNSGPVVRAIDPNTLLGPKTGDLARGSTPSQANTAASASPGLTGSPSLSVGAKGLSRSDGAASAVRSVIPSGGQGSQLPPDKFRFTSDDLARKGTIDLSRGARDDQVQTINPGLSVMQGAQPGGASPTATPLSTARGTPAAGTHVLSGGAANALADAPGGLSSNRTLGGSQQDTGAGGSVAASICAAGGCSSTEWKAEGAAAARGDAAPRINAATSRVIPDGQIMQGPGSAADHATAFASVPINEPQPTASQPPAVDADGVLAAASFGPTNTGPTNTGQTSTGQTSTGQTNAGQTSTDQTSTDQTSNTGQAGNGQTNAGQTNAGQTGSDQTGRSGQSARADQAASGGDTGGAGQTAEQGQKGKSADTADAAAKRKSASTKDEADSEECSSCRAQCQQVRRGCSANSSCRTAYNACMRGCWSSYCRGS
jgi:hypothetical protein